MARLFLRIPKIQRCTSIRNLDFFWFHNSESIKSSAWESSRWWSVFLSDIDDHFRSSGKQLLAHSPNWFIEEGWMILNFLKTYVILPTRTGEKRCLLLKFRQLMEGSKSRKSASQLMKKCFAYSMLSNFFPWKATLPIYRNVGKPTASSVRPFK